MWGLLLLLLSYKAIQSAIDQGYSAVEVKTDSIYTIKGTLESVYGSVTSAEVQVSVVELPKTCCREVEVCIIRLHKGLLPSPTCTCHQRPSGSVVRVSD